MKYFEALKIAINRKHLQQQRAVVLDIGTGSGLLSMMAAVAGADWIYACEVIARARHAFQPMADCASKVIERNKLSEKITLIPKRSTDLTVGEGKDLSTRANILVTEVFDTELIGEGAIGTFNHAHEHLLTEDCIVIPESATIYAQVVDCPLVPKWNTIFPISVSKDVIIKFPEKIARCAGVPSVHDVQLSEIKPNQFLPLSDPIPIFGFTWNNHFGPIPISRSSKLELIARNSGAVNAVFTWWELKMDTEGTIVISCEPSWMKGKNFAWRDHWMQSIYYISDIVKVELGDDFHLESFHDEYSLWFRVFKDGNLSVVLPSTEHPVCECGVHTVLSRSRIAMMNDDLRNETFLNILLQNIIPEQSICLCISNGSLLPLIAAGLKSKRVFVVETCHNSARVLEEFVVYNNMQHKVTVLKKALEDLTAEDFDFLKIDLVLGDPFFQSSVYPWNNLLFWYHAATLRWSLSERCLIIPSKAVLNGIAVNFEELWKIKAPVDKACNGLFSLIDFDSLILKSSAVSDCLVDMQPLWEYPGTASSSIIHLIDINFNNIIAGDIIKNDGTFLLNQKPNGIAVWIDWYLSDDDYISTGPTRAPSPGKLIDWNIGSQQGVFIFHDDVLCGTPGSSTMSYKVGFESQTGEINFSFPKQHLTDNLIDLN